MNRYIDAEKLKAELRRQKRELELSIQSQGDYGQSCHIIAYENICNLIASLQQEPEVDLEKEIRDTCRGYRINDHYEQELGKQDIDNIARYFYELGLKARKGE